MFGKIAKALRQNILIGFALVVPIAVTILIANALFTWVTNRILPSTLRDAGYDVIFRVTALVIVLMLLFLTGFFVRSFLGKKLYRLSESILVRIPFINNIYVWVRQISETVIAQRQKLFKEVVLVEYPRRGLYCIGFVTSAVPGNFRGEMVTANEHEDKELVALFIPTTPNPTSGVLVFAPSSEVHFLPLNIPDAMKLIISGGAVYPGAVGESGSEPTLLDKLEAWATHDDNPDTVEEGRPDRKSHQQDQPFQED